MLAMLLPVSRSKAKSEATANPKPAGTFKAVNVYCRIYLLLDIYLMLLPSMMVTQKRMLLKKRRGGAESLRVGQFICHEKTSFSHRGYIPNNFCDASTNLVLTVASCSCVLVDGS